MSDINIYLEPMQRSNQGENGYTEKGLRDAFEMDLELYADEKLEKVAHANDVPLDRELFFDRKIEGHVLQIAVATEASEFRLTRNEFYLTNYDRARWPSMPKMTEKDYQAESAKLNIWFTRHENKLLDFITSFDYSSLYSGNYINVMGPDEYGASAFDLNGPTAFVLGDLNKVVTFWSTNNNPVVVDQGYTTEVIGQKDIIDETQTPITWYFLKTTITGPTALSIYTFQANGTSYFDMRFYTETVVDTNVITYIFDDVVENNANAVCPRWF